MGCGVYSGMKTTAPTMNHPKATLPTGYTQSDERFDATCRFVDIEGLGEKKKGRLGRMVWEFKTADLINRNRRLYPAGVVAMAVQGFQERIDKNVVFGNLDHPSIFDYDSLMVMLSEAAVKIVETKMTSDTDIKVTADILDNDQGRQLISVLEVDGNPGISQRAIARWRDPTDAEREKYNIPDDEFIDVAESLRLITYDVVSEPGFADAEGAKVTESHQGVDSMETVAELKAKYPKLYEEVFNNGRAAGEAKTESAIENARSGIVEEVTKPLNDKIEEIEAAKNKALEALAAMKPALVSLGIVNEQITDAEAAAKVATAEAQVKTLGTEKAILEAQLTEANEKLAKHGKMDRIRSALKTVSDQYQGHKAHDNILRQVASRNIENEGEALEAARAVAAFIEEINPSMKPGANATNDKPTFNVNILDGLLKENPADPNGAKPVDESKNQLGVASLAGLSVGF